MYSHIQRRLIFIWSKFNDWCIQIKECKENTYLINIWSVKFWFNWRLWNKVLEVAWWKYFTPNIFSFNQASIFETGHKWMCKIVKIVWLSLLSYVAVSIVFDWFERWVSNTRFDLPWNMLRVQYLREFEEGYVSSLLIAKTNE